ncbi:MAG: MBL fold metallo-hydrolase [Pseudomonadota bacterium]
MSKQIGLIIALLLTGSAQAQDRFANVSIQATPLTESVYLLTGSGGNMGLVVGERHAFLIDDQFAPLAERIAAKIVDLTDRPLSFVLNTHWHGDHSGGNAAFAESGVVVVAHENVYRRMSTDQVNEFFNRTTPASPNEALPVVTFTRDLALRLGGRRVRIMHVPSAHTDGDSVVYLPDQNVLHTGDLFFHTLYPFIDVDSGGGIRGLVDGLSMLLESIDADTKIIPGHGPVADRDDLRAYRDFLATSADAIAAHIAAGHTLAETVAAKPTADFDAEFNANGFLEPDRWVAMVYRDLSRSVE